MGELPYRYYVCKPRKNKKYSYGILCISKDGQMVINKSPPYIKSNINRKYFKQRYGYIRLNTNEKYNLDLGLFPDATLEGEFTLPKGQMDHMDKKNSIFTKIREFIEETKYTHPHLNYLLKKYFDDPNFKSFLNDENVIIKEEWLGLDGKIYHCEYSVFLIDSMTELIPIRCYNNNNNNNNDIVLFEYFSKNFSVYSNCDKYYKEYKKSSKLGSLKKTLFTFISSGIFLLNEHKINIYTDDDSRIKLQDISNIFKKKHNKKI